MITRLSFFFNDTATTEIYTLSLHDALPISRSLTSSTTRPAAAPAGVRCSRSATSWTPTKRPVPRTSPTSTGRSEEHTSELQSRQYLVCRLLLEKKHEFDRSLARGHHAQRQV